MNFHDLATTAAIGTGQRPFRAEQLPDALRPLIDPGTEPAHQVLDAAAGWEIVRRAQLRTGEQPVDVPEAAETRPEAPANLATLLRRILDLADGDRVLAETCSAFHAAGFRLPHRLLVPVLERARREPAVTVAAQPVMGARGAWLLEAVPRLSRSLGEPQAKDWDGTAALRRNWLKHLNHTDPAAAVELLAADWATESVENRVSFLEVFRAEPHPAQVDFLEQALLDRSERVATTAQETLAKLPASPWRERMVGYAAGLRLQEGGLVLAEKPTGKQANRDGATTNYAARTIVGAVPPAEWPRLLNLTAVELAERCRDDQPTLLALARAAVTFADAGLATAMVGPVMQATDPGIPDGFLELVDIPTRLAVAAQAQAPSLALEALQALPAPWPQQVIDIALARLDEWRVGKKRQAEALFTHLEQAVSPWLAAEAARRTNPEPRHPNEPIKRATRLITVLTLRAAVADEIRPYLNQENR